MNIAFYAPMKHPGASVPSGDVAIARGIIAALEQAGHQVDVVSRLRTWQADPDPERQLRLAKISRLMAQRLMRRFRARPAASQPDLWFTYHLYYKAPDWLGPEVSRVLDIPYVVAEASHAPKRLGGPWDVGHRAAEAAIRAADRVFGLNSLDAACIRPLLDDPAKLVQLRPFMDIPPMIEVDQRNARRDVIAARYRVDGDAVWLLTVAMMRDDAKLESYRVLADAYRRLTRRDTTLFVVGDGAARERVEKAFADQKVVFTGRLEGELLASLLDTADIYVWPAVNEAYGMALLEAQAHGLPVVAGRAGGVADIVRDGKTGLLTPEGDAAAMAAAIAGLCDDPTRRNQMGKAARHTVVAEHSLTAATAILDGALREIAA